MLKLNIEHKIYQYKIHAFQSENDVFVKLNCSVQNGYIMVKVIDLDAI